jgi:hypothetical protein
VPQDGGFVYRLVRPVGFVRSKTRSAAQTVLAASEEVENAAVKLRGEMEDFLRNTVAA